MPVYEFACENGHRTETYAKAAQRPEFVKCPICDCIATRVFSPVYIVSDTNNPYRYHERALGIYGASRREVEAYMRDRGIVMASRADCDVLTRQASQEKRQLMNKLAQLEAEHARLPESARMLLTETEYSRLPPEDKKRFPKPRVVPDSAVRTDGD